jgi:hypothetical protein
MRSFSPGSNPMRKLEEKDMVEQFISYWARSALAFSKRMSSETDQLQVQFEQENVELPSTVAEPHRSLKYRAE